MPAWAGTWACASCTFWQQCYEPLAQGKEKRFFRVGPYFRREIRASLEEPKLIEENMEALRSCDFFYKTTQQGQWSVSRPPPDGPTGPNVNFFV